MTSLRPQLESLRFAASKVRTAAERLATLSYEQLTWKPSPDRWNSLQILDHLNRTHALCAPKFAVALDDASPAGEEGSSTIKFGFVDRVFLKFMSGEAPIKAPVPPIFEPEASPDRKQTLRRFFEFHDAVADVIERSNAFRLEGLRVTSPVSEKFRPGYLAYLTGLVLHEKYHWEQIEALVAAPGYPKQ